eukprot:7376622-Alexandrium_andersonii.AAC.1
MSRATGLSSRTPLPSPAGPPETTRASSVMPSGSRGWNRLCPLLIRLRSGRRRPRTTRRRVRDVRSASPSRRPTTISVS